MERERLAASRAAGHSSSAAGTGLRRDFTTTGVRRATLGRMALAAGLLAALASAVLGATPSASARGPTVPAGKNG